MRLERTTSSLPILVIACGLLALGACGDDSTPGTGDGTSTGTVDGTTTSPMTSPTTMTTMETVDTTMTPETTEEPTTDPTVDPTTTGTDSTDTGESTDTSTGDPPGECTGMSFSMLTSMDNDMTTNLDVAGLVSCNMDITLTATGGTICAVDDGAGGFFYTVETIALEDVPPVMCGLATVGLTNLSIINTGDYMEVVVDQGGGTTMGNQSIDVLGDVEGMALGMPVGPAPLMDFSGMLPEGEVEFGAGDTTVTYADNGTVIATAMPEVAPGVMVTVTLTGLEGSLTFAM